MENVGNQTMYSYKISISKVVLREKYDSFIKNFYDIRYFGKLGINKKFLQGRKKYEKKQEQYDPKPRNEFEKRLFRYFERVDSLEKRRKNKLKTKEQGGKKEENR
ncbi:hypothetical protein [Enterococcus sp. 5B3_DIV0040]|uniref:hypothetical protein n=1 Tax=Enterococcus sp. 5B3_DIV0040 TaxID=1834182 RepID=UPI000A338555|nr:hypothetical protein [Enterococcus sp. 5B3_DIV0040]OTO01268.1 hypothetical protein A5883_003585 [Enterococcus sp. 5B3_DIV0040]